MLDYYCCFCYFRKWLIFELFDFLDIVLFFGLVQGGRGMGGGEGGAGGGVGGGGGEGGGGEGGGGLYNLDFAILQN